MTSLATRTTDRVIKSSFPRHCLPPPVVPWCWKAALSPVQRRLCLSNESTSCTLVYDFHPRGKALFDGSAAPSPSSVTATVTSHLAAAALAHDATLLCRVWLMVQFALEHKLYHFLSKFRTSADVFVSLQILLCFSFIFFFITKGLDWRLNEAQKKTLRSLRKLLQNLPVPFGLKWTLHVNFF